jgi:hypothetical protein
METRTLLGKSDPNYVVTSQDRALARAIRSGNTREMVKIKSMAKGDFDLMVQADALQSKNATVKKMALDLDKSKPEKVDQLYLAMLNPKMAEDIQMAALIK